MVEAFLDLVRDLQNIGATGSNDSSIYKPEYFDADDKRVWHAARAVFKTGSNSSHEETDWPKIHATIESLREHLQKYLGGLQEFTMYTYINKEKMHGYDVMQHVGDVPPKPKPGYIQSAVQTARLFAYESGQAIPK